MSSGLDKAVVHLDLLPLLAEVHLRLVDAALSCVHRQWLLEAFSSPCSDVTTQSRLVPMLRCQRFLPILTLFLTLLVVLIMKTTNLVILCSQTLLLCCISSLHFLYFRNSLASNTQSDVQPVAS